MPFSMLTGQYESGTTFRGAAITQDLSLGLLHKHKFRAYSEFADAVVTIKLVFTVPFLLTSQRLWTGRGAARAVVRTGSTESGTFTALATKFCMNTLGGDVVGLTTALVGGSVTGGTEREVLLSDSGTAGGGSGNADLLDGLRILGAGTYYIVITPSGTTLGKWAIEWEELPELA